MAACHAFDILVDLTMDRLPPIGACEIPEVAMVGMSEEAAFEVLRVSALDDYGRPALGRQPPGPADHPRRGWPRCGAAPGLFGGLLPVSCVNAVAYPLLSLPPVQAHTNAVEARRPDLMVCRLVQPRRRSSSQRVLWDARSSP
jgi:hypothetical protein